MKVEQGTILYARCDCCNNFRKGQKVTVDIVKEGISIDGVAIMPIDVIKRYFTDKYIDVLKEEKSNTDKDEELVAYLTTKLHARNDKFQYTFEELDFTDYDLYFIIDKIREFKSK